MEKKVLELVSFYFHIHTSIDNLKPIFTVLKKKSFTCSNHIREKDRIWIVFVWMSYLLTRTRKILTKLVTVEYIAHQHWVTHGLHYHTLYKPEAATNQEKTSENRNRRKCIIISMNITRCSINKTLSLITRRSIRISNLTIRCIIVKMLFFLKWFPSVHSKSWATVCVRIKIALKRSYQSDVNMWY